MLRQPTLFVIGAGASKELHFPLGSDLLGALSELFNFERDTFGVWRGPDAFRMLANAYSAQQSVDPNLLFEKAIFIRSKIRGLAKSIDQLIYTYSKDELFVTVAKLGIAQIISAAEATHLPKLQNHLPIQEQPWGGNNWLRTFCSHYFAGYHRSDAPRLYDDVSFVSFNYDRCIEYALLRATAHHFHLNDDQAFDALKRVKIEHPYGSLGELPTGRAAVSHSFGTPQTNETLLSMARNLKTFTEGTVGENTKEKIGKLIENSRSIVCLGFGYNAMNVELISNPTEKGKIVYGTTFALSEPNAASAKSSMCRQVKAGEINAVFKALGAAEFLNEYELALFK